MIRAPMTFQERPMDVLDEEPLAGGVEHKPESGELNLSTQGRKPLGDITQIHIWEQRACAQQAL